MYRTEISKSMTKIDFWGENMDQIKLHIHHFGAAYARPEWYLSPVVKMQRLYYIFHGKGSYAAANGVRCAFEPGKIYLFPYNLTQHFESDPEDPIYHLFFDFISTPPVIATQPLCYDASQFPVLRQLAETSRTLLEGEKALAGRTASSADAVQLREHLLQLWLGLLSTCEPIPFSNDTVVCDTLDYIRKHFHTPITVPELAARAGFEENYFIRRFRNVMGQTPYAYLRDHRLMCARQMISSGLSITETAVRVGYENASSLSRALRFFEK